MSVTSLACHFNVVVMIISSWHPRSPCRNRQCAKFGVFFCFCFFLFFCVLMKSEIQKNITNNIEGMGERGREGGSGKR